MNICLLASHAVAEYDDLRMFHDLGYNVFAPGGYEVPYTEGEGIRPPLPQVTHYPDLVALCQDQRAKGGDPGPWIDWAKANLHPAVIEWADVIIAHHFVDPWLTGQWKYIRHKRVIWRTCGQSNPELERVMTPLADDGLEIVRYSPAERRYFGEIGSFAGETAMIRFGKYPDDYGPWTGDLEAVGNLTQDMIGRGDACGYDFWQAATEGLPTAPAGKGSESLRNGLGALTYTEMLNYLSSLRAYLYTGTRPASYTLGLIEAMLSGVPVVSIGPKAWGFVWNGSDLFEAHEMVPGYDDPMTAQSALRELLDDTDLAAEVSVATRQRAIDLFGIDTVGPQWKALLG